MAPTSLIRGVIFHLPTLLRASSAPFKRAAAASLSDTSEYKPHAGREPRALSEEEELERRVRMEVMGGGSALRDQQQEGGGGGVRGVVEGLARALGVGMKTAAGGEVPDPRSTPVQLHTPSPSSGYATSPHEPANLFTPKSNISLPPHLRPGVSRPAAGADQLRAKYLAKVREKTGKVLAPQGGGMNERAMDEAERRLTARRLVQGTEAQTGAGGSSSSSSLSLSVLDILHYVKWRGLRTGLLLGTRRHEQPDLSALLGRHRRDLDFDCITPTKPEGKGKEEQEEKGWEAEEVRWAVRRLSLEPSKTLVVASDKAALEGARAMGCFTCRVEGTSGGSGGSYAVASLDEIKTVIEDLNGVSLRQRDSLL